MRLSGVLPVVLSLKIKFKSVYLGLSSFVWVIEFFIRLSFLKANQEF